jgi:hypothetical protein
MSPHESLASSRPGKKLGFVRRLRAKSIGSSSHEIEKKEKDSRQCMAKVFQLLEAGEGGECWRVSVGVRV